MRTCSVRMSAGWTTPRWIGTGRGHRHSACARRTTPRNASLARAVVEGLGIPGASDDKRLADAVQGFEGLPSRCRSLGSIGAVEFVDDGLSTNVLPAQAALLAFAERPVALLVGGHDRGVDYTPLAETIGARSSPTLVVTMPDNGPRIGQAVHDASDGRVEVIDAGSLEAAVDAAVAWSEPGGVVLLSPAAPSFGRFADYRERSAAFAQAAGRYGTLS